MARKIKVGDWVIAPSGQVFDIHYVATSYTYVSDIRGTQYRPDEVRPLPASPAVLAKSHRLLMRFWKTRHSGASQFDVERFIYAHCRRIPKGKK